VAERSPHLEGWLSTPLVGRNEQTIGFVQVSNKEAQEAFDADDEDLLVKFARIAAVTLESALYRNAREANRLKDEFLAILSHELRNPLNSMLGWARLLRMGELDEETRQRALDVIERNIKSQAKLIDDLLDLSQISSGRIRLEVAPVNLDAVIEGVVDALRPVAEDKGLELRLEWEATGTRVAGDAERLGQVVWNLLTNAIKFTPSGGRVAITVQRTRSWVEIVVRDNGEGIDPGLLPHVFDHYWQGAKRKGGVGGLGLGLAIVRQMVELHAGEIRAQSEGQGKGATFLVRLPCLGETSIDAPEGEGDYVMSIAQRRTLDEVPRLDGIRVLVVDDERDSREFLLAALRHQGADAVAVASSEAALEALDHLNPDVLVSDIIMPGEDGCALLKRVRSRGAVRGGEVPALALTGSLRGEDERQRVLSAGFQVFMPKPIELMDLVTHIAQLARSPAETRGEAAVE
jgi:signal transduction histidine kinase/CheY-like chemotaxis protein